MINDGGALVVRVESAHARESVRNRRVKSVSGHGVSSLSSPLFEAPISKIGFQPVRDRFCNKSIKVSNSYPISAPQEFITSFLHLQSAATIKCRL